MCVCVSWLAQVTWFACVCVLGIILFAILMQCATSSWLWILISEVRFILQMKVVYDLKWYQLKSVEDLKIVEKDCSQMFAGHFCLFEACSSPVMG